MASEKARRKHYTAAEKVAILRRHLVEQVPVSDLCDEQRLHPNVFYRWQKEFFENSAAAFQKEHDRETKRYLQQIRWLEAKLERKNEVLSELMEEHVALKKGFGER